MTNKNLTGFFLCNYKIFLTQEKAKAQAKLDGLSEYCVSYHPAFSENWERCRTWKNADKIEWGNPATYRKPKSTISSEPVLTPVKAVMRMEEYYRN